MAKLKKVFFLSWVPVGLGFIVASLLAFSAFFVTYPDYYFMVWDQLFTDLIPVYFAVTVAFVLANTIFISTIGRTRYPFSISLLCNLFAFFLALLITASWYAA